MTTTLTTADIAAYVADRLAQMRSQAGRYHACAIEQAGNHGSPWANMISTIGDMVDALRELEALVDRFGDGDAKRQIYAQIREAQDWMIDREHQARMSSIPGWDPVTKSVRPAAA